MQTTTATTTDDTTTIATTSAALARLNKTAGSTLDDLAKAARRSMLLADVSGSMGDPIRSGGRKIDALRAVVTDLRSTHAVPIAAFGIDTSRSASGIMLLDEGQRLPEPDGLTPLAQAIDFGAQMGATHLVVVTDGIPDSETRAFDAARAFGHPIDVFYCGDGHDRGAQFAKELAALTGGTANLADLGKPKALKAGIAGLLGDGSGI